MRVLTIITETTESGFCSPSFTIRATFAMDIRSPVH
jgi:hypothetical protein